MQKVFVLDCEEKPLSPCSQARARILLKGNAVVFCKNPFTIKLLKLKEDTNMLENISREENSLNDANSDYYKICKQLLEDSFCGQILNTKWLESDQIESYEKDIDVPALLVSEDAQKFETAVKGNRVFPIQFVLTGKAATPEEAMYKLIEKENFLTTLFLIKATSTYGKCSSKDRRRKANYQNRITVLPEEITRKSLSFIQNKVESSRFIVDKFIFNSSAVSNFVDKDIFDPITSTDLLQLGYLGSIWGINVIKFICNPSHSITSKIFEKIGGITINDNIVLAVTVGISLGVRGIRSFCFLKNEEDDGYIASCIESMTILNPFAIAGGFSEMFIEKDIKITNFSIDV